MLTSARHVVSLLIHGARLLDAVGATPDGWIHVDDRRVLAVGRGADWRHVADSAAPPEVLDAAGGTVVPGFVDLHVHGGGGASFEDGADAVGLVLATHHARGTTRLVASLVSRPVPALVASLTELAALRAVHPGLAGVHLEGPFLAPTRTGAHDAGALALPTPDAVDALLAAADGCLAQVTLAPELPGSQQAIRSFVDAGVVVAVGHTEATYAQTRAAFDAGARLLTHAFNAMPGLHHRAPGPVLAAIDDGDAVLEVINDGLHVDEAVVRMLFRAAPGRVALVTDAMSAAGAGDGEYRLGPVPVTVRGGAARLEDGRTLAGSTLTQDMSVARALAAGVDARATVAAATLTPARVLGLGDGWGRLRRGAAPELVLLDASGAVRRVVGPGSAPLGRAPATRAWLPDRDP